MSKKIFAKATRRLAFVGIAFVMAMPFAQQASAQAKGYNGPFGTKSILVSYAGPYKDICDRTLQNFRNKGFTTSPSSGPCKGGLLDGYLFWVKGS